MNIIPFTVYPGLMAAKGFPYSMHGAWAIGAALVKRVYDLAAHYFQILQSIGLISYAAKEILIDYLPLSKGMRVSNKRDPILHRVGFREDIFVRQISDKHFKNIHDIKASHFLGQGILYGSAGILSLGASLHGLHYIALGAALPFFHYGGLSLFLFGCLFSLERHIRIYQEANLMEDASVGESHELAKRIKISAILGMVSDISYIVLTAFSLFGGGFAPYIVFACLAIFSIALKNIYDFFFLNMPVE